MQVTWPGCSASISRIRSHAKVSSASRHSARCVTVSRPTGRRSDAAIGGRPLTFGYSNTARRVSFFLMTESDTLGAVTGTSSLPGSPTWVRTGLRRGVRQLASASWHRLRCASLKAAGSKLAATRGGNQLLDRDVKDVEMLALVLARLDSTVRKPIRAVRTGEADADYPGAQAGWIRDGAHDAWQTMFLPHERLPHWRRFLLVDGRDGRSRGRGTSPESPVLRLAVQHPGRDRCAPRYSEEFDGKSRKLRQRVRFLAAGRGQ